MEPQWKDAHLVQAVPFMKYPALQPHCDSAVREVCPLVFRPPHDVQEVRVADQVSLYWFTGQEPQVVPVMYFPAEHPHAPMAVRPVAPLVFRVPVQATQEVSREFPAFQVFTGQVTPVLVLVL